MITHTINQFSDEINRVNTLNLIINSLLILQIHLNQITNAITFANVNKIHPTFLSMENLNSMATKVKSAYPATQIVNFNDHHSYYSFLGIQLIFKDDRIIFLIQFPVLMPQNFKTYFIYPIPINKKIILPNKPYLILNERSVLHQYQDEPCEEVENVYYCLNHLLTEENCVVNIIRKIEPNNCTTILVHLDKAIANQVTPHNIIFTTEKKAVLTESCSIEKHHELGPGSYIITIENNCHFSINQEIFTAGNEYISPATIIQLPQLNMSLLQQRPTYIKLTSLDMEEIKHLTKKLNTEKEVNILDDQILEKKSIPTWIHFLIYLMVALLIFLGVTWYYRTCYPYPYQCKSKKKNKKEEIKMEEQP